jgi:hypothetical protein
MQKNKYYVIVLSGRSKQRRRFRADIRLITGHMAAFYVHGRPWTHPWDKATAMSSSWEVASYIAAQIFLNILLNPKCRFVAAFTSALSWPLSWVEAIGSMAPYPSSLWSTNIPFTRLSFILPSAFLPSKLTTKILYAVIFAQVFLHIQRIISPMRWMICWWRLQVMKFLIM